MLEEITVIGLEDSALYDLLTDDLYMSPKRLDDSKEIFKKWEFTAPQLNHYLIHYMFKISHIGNIYRSSQVAQNIILTSNPTADTDKSIRDFQELSKKYLDTFRPPYLILTYKKAVGKIRRVLEERGISVLEM